MLKDVFSTFDMSGCLCAFALYNNPMNSASSTSRLSSTKYVASYSSRESDLESIRWDMKFPDISSFAADIQWRLDTHWGFWISHVASRTKSIFTSSSLLGL